MISQGNWKHVAMVSFCILLVLVVYIVSKGTSNGNPMSGYFRPVRKQSSSLSGVSGLVFKGEKIRAWTGQPFAIEGPMINDMLVSRQIESKCSIPMVAVTTTISNDLSIIKDFKKNPITRKIPIVIAGDLKGPVTKELEKFLEFPLQEFKSPFKGKDASNGPVYLLTVPLQKQLFPVISKLTPTRHFGRKNLGYLAGMAMGACVIWDFDDDNYPLFFDFFTPEYTRNLKKNISPYTLATRKSQAVNPYVLMGATTDPSWTKASSPIWPRGLPITDKNLEEIPTLFGTEYLPSRSGLKGLYSTGVIQSLANHDPDVDAIYRLTSALPIDFHSQLPLVNIHPSQFTPFNGQATAFFSDAFWSMYLPVTVHGRVSDIWRGYIAQALMRCTGHLLTFHKPIVTQFRNAHNYQGDLNAEQPLYQQTEALIAALESFKCSSQLVSQCLIDLYIDLYERNFIQSQDVEAIRVWVRTLVILNYTFPPIKPSLCSPSSKKYFRLTKPTRPRNEAVQENAFDALAVVHVNGGSVEAIPIWKSLYQHMFSEMVFYCPGAKVCRSMATRKIHCINSDRLGLFKQESMAHALTHYTGYSTYVSSQDDAAISPCLIRRALHLKQTVVVKSNPAAEFKSGFPSDCLHAGLSMLRENAKEKTVLQDILNRCPANTRIQRLQVPFANFVLHWKDNATFVVGAKALSRCRVTSPMAIPWLLHCAVASTPAVENLKFVDCAQRFTTGQSVWDSEFCPKSEDLHSRAFKKPCGVIAHPLPLHGDNPKIMPALAMTQCLAAL